VAGNRTAVISSAAKFVRMSLQIAILGTGAWLAIQQIVTPGAMIAASIIMSRALAPIEAAIGSWRHFVQARIAYKRLKSGLDGGAETAGPVPTRLPAPQGRVAVKNASLRRDGHDHPVLQNISFTMEPGEALGIIGPSGAGKSTLAQLLVGLDKPDFGSVTLDGVEITDWPASQIGPHIGYLPQEVDLISGTVAQNIARFSQHEDPEQHTDRSDTILAAVRSAGAHELIAALPRHYETQVGENGRLISGGQRQRIALARAFYGDIRLAVLDEPNASLDAEGETALRGAIGRMKKEGRTVVVISHTPSILRAVDRILVLRGGQMQALGPRDEIMAQRIAVARGKAKRDAAAVHEKKRAQREHHAQQ
jgi:PrtD family type I secretion system ABC transporter